MSNLIGGMVFMILGLFLAIFSNQIALMTASFYRKLFTVHFNEKGYRIGFLIVGILFLVFGILSILHII